MHLWQSHSTACDPCRSSLLLGISGYIALVPRFSTSEGPAIDQSTINAEQITTRLVDAERWTESLPPGRAAGFVDSELQVTARCIQVPARLLILIAWWSQHSSLPTHDTHGASQPGYRIGLGVAIHDPSNLWKAAPSGKTAEPGLLFSTLSHSTLTTNRQSATPPLHGGPPKSSGLSVGISHKDLPTHSAATAAVVFGEEHVGLLENTPELRFSLQREFGKT